MTDLVDETLSHWRKTPFEWGKSDCLLSIADYLKQATGNDWGAPFRGKYTDEFGAQFFIQAYGNEIQLLDTTALEHTYAPERGDVALLMFGGYQIACLCTGHSFAARMQTGVAEINYRFAKVICGWKVK